MVRLEPFGEESSLMGDSRIEHHLDVLRSYCHRTWNGCSQLYRTRLDC
jgi:hypothetical protein